MTTDHIHSARRERKPLGKRRRFSVLRRDRFRCRYRGERGAVSPLQVDHIIPVCLGGPDIEPNLVTACRACNSGKGGNHVLEPASDDACDLALSLVEMHSGLRATRSERDAIIDLFNAEVDGWGLLRGLVLGQPVSVTISKMMRCAGFPDEAQNVS